MNPFLGETKLVARISQFAPIHPLRVLFCAELSFEVIERQPQALFQSNLRLPF